MNAAQREIVDHHRSNIIEILTNYSDTAVWWLRNKRYLTPLALDQVLAERSNIAKATRILDLLTLVDNGWLGLTEFLKEHSAEDFTCALHLELNNTAIGASDYGHRKGVPADADLNHAEPLFRAPAIGPATSTPVWLVVLQNQLKSFYRGSFSHVELFPNAPESSVPLEKIWVNLTVAAYLEKVTHDNYLEVLNVALQSSLSVTIVKGEPGMGKTTFVQKLCLDWSIGNLPQFDLVICGKMRSVPQADTLLDVALNWTTSRCREINFDCLKKNLKVVNLLIILDGFDESVCQCKDVERLLKSREPFLLPFKLVITTRPYKLYEIACQHQLLTLCGFTLSQQLQFVENVCELQSRYPNVRKPKPIAVQDRIKHIASLNELSRIPLFIYFLCSLNHVEGLDGSVTKLLFLLCESLVSRYRMSTQASAELSNWRESKWFASLGALALHGLMDFDHGKLCFDDADLERFSIDSNHVAYSIGFLNKEEIVTPTGGARKVSASFPHKTVQEFFAALALSTNDSDLLHSVVKLNLQQDFFDMLDMESHKRLEMQQVLIFLAGMAGGRASLLGFLRSHFYVLKPLWEDQVVLLQQVQIELANQQAADDILREYFVGRKPNKTSIPYLPPTFYIIAPLLVANMLCCLAGLNTLTPARQTFSLIAHIPFLRVEQMVRKVMRKKFWLTKKRPWFDLNWLAGCNWQFAINVCNTYFRREDSTAIPCKLKDSSQLLFWNSDYSRCEAYCVNMLDKHSIVDHLRNNCDQFLDKVWFTGTEQQLAEVADILQMSEVPWNLLRVAVERGGEDTCVVCPPVPTLKGVVIDTSDYGTTRLVPGAMQSLLEVQPAIESLAFLGAENQRVTSLDCHCWPNTTTQLYFCQVNFDAALASQLCQALERLHITLLVIRKGSLQLEAFACLCCTLSKQRHLEWLSIVSIRMDGLQTPEGCHTFVECFQRLTFLQTLCITDCGITDAVAECLLDSHHAMNDLIMVYLEFNPLSQVMKSKLRKFFSQRAVRFYL